MTAFGIERFAGARSRLVFTARTGPIYLMAKGGNDAEVIRSPQKPTQRGIAVSVSVLPRDRLREGASDLQASAKEEYMDTASLLIKAMAEECRGWLLEWRGPDMDLPQALQPKHLERMCGRIERHAEDWSSAKLHRWIGFVQCAMMANRILDLDGIKAMFDKAKNAYGETSEDLLDHLDPRDSFEFEIGGEG